MKALPLGALGNANLRLVIRWNDFVSATNTPIVANGLTEYDVRNVSLVYEELEFSAQDASNIMKETGGQFIINTTGIEVHKKTLSSGLSSDTTLIPVKKKQLKSILTAYYLDDKAILNRQRPFQSNGGEFSYVVGSKHYPQQPVRM